MSNHTCKAIVVTCIDFRFQSFIADWLKKHFQDGEYDRVAYAGGIYDLETAFKQIEISKRLHHINQVVFINHEDCGAYGAEGNYQRHITDLSKAKDIVNNIYPDMSVNLYYLHLDGVFERVESKSVSYSDLIASGSAASEGSAQDSI